MSAINLPKIGVWRDLSESRRREALAGYLFISPWLIGFIVFFLGPIIASLILSFTRWNIVGDPIWVGLDNYQTIFGEDLRFKKAVEVTITYSIFYLPLEVICGIGLAVLMNLKLRGIGLFRTLFYMPSVVPQVAAALVWVWMLNQRYGVLNTLLKQVGVTGPNWLGSPYYVLPSLIMIALWGVGGSAIIYLAGLQNIPEVLYEAATVDGANVVQKFFKITLPLLSPTIFFQLVLGLIGVFQTFTPAFIAAGENGGPLQSGLFYMLYIYNRGFVSLRMGYASALAWIMTVFILVVTVLVLRSSRYWVYYETDRSRNQ
ncbi:MAG: sugar ABC transporter permease [Anaerolineaceae bacterium]|nr:sugar ABC transporter permease [Anaerolineaceae bacterium]